MVVVFPDAPPPFDWGQLFNLNNIIMFALTSSLIAGTIYLFSGSAEAQSNLEQNSYYLEAEDAYRDCRRNGYRESYRLDRQCP